ncbi:MULTISPECIES: hypothetical protein [unclassified Mesorhizobium]|uniref:hypothetical protein n=1 Tax=unclassified Mesorhizobium TaxID=325217 RepID=UPI0015E2C5BE|nr:MULTISPECIES: hypothetical protein [unclassified Mesorhizobium]
MPKEGPARVENSGALVVFPDHAPNHTDPDKPPHAYLHNLGSAGEQDVHIKLPPLASLTPQVPFDIPERKVPHELEEVPRQIVARDVAVDATDADQLPDVVGTAERLNDAAGSAAGLRHGQPIGSYSSKSQFTHIDIFVPFLFDVGMGD